jgi:glycosyltransferase involved in cell wall biosynthesis
MAAFQNCAYLSVVSKKMKEFMMSEFHISEKKIIVVPNGSNLAKYRATFSRPLNVIYAGHLVYWEGVQDYLEIAKRASNNFKFYLAGDGPLKNFLLNRIESENIPITYLGLVNRPRMLKIFSQMHIGIAPSSKDLTRVVASPIKVYDYLSAGLPVITPNIGDWGEFIARKQCGVALTDDSVSSYIAAIESFSSESTWRLSSQNAISAIISEHTWDKALEPLVNLLSKTTPAEVMA